MKKTSRNIALLAIPVILLAVLLSGGCSPTDGGGFAVFLTRSDIPPAQMPGLGKVELAGQPEICMRDIVAYNTQTHELKLSAGCYDRICSLDVPVSGKSFVVCADRKTVYWGAFWTPVSSISFDGVTVCKPYSKEQARIITFELGYPSPSFYRGLDPRNSPELMRPLELAGKLIAKHTISSVNALPRSMKGYELYSWSRDGKWYFTLMTGTNRNKTGEEILSGEDYISEAGPVIIHAAGIDAIKAALGKMPRGEQIAWLVPVESVTATGTAKFAVPSTPVINNLKEYAGQRGLELKVP